MGALTITIRDRSVQGNKRTYYGTFTGSTSYSTSGETYTIGNFGLNRIDQLDVYPASGYVPEWNSAGASVIMRRDVAASRVLTLAPSGSAGVEIRVSQQGLERVTGTVATVEIPTALRPFTFLDFVANTSASANHSNQLSTSDTTTVQITHNGTTYAGTSLYVTTAGSLYTTASVSPLGVLCSDGSVVPVGIDTTATFQVWFTGTAATGLRLATSMSVSVNVAVSTSLSAGSMREVPSGTDLSGVTFRWRAFGA